ncbi:VOC family protein [Undibacterium sp.]
MITLTMTEPVFKVQQIDHIVLRVRNVERSITFYG